MEARQQRGLMIAATVRLRHRGQIWTVPSQVGNGTVYRVDLKSVPPTCSCPDYETRNLRCKHIFAVEFSTKREMHPNGIETVTNTVRVTRAPNWSAYNAALTNEKTRVAELLQGLCEGVVTPRHERGRPRIPLSDAVFSIVMKVYSTVSARRATSDLRDYGAKGHIAHIPHYNSVFNYLQDPTLTPLLKSLIEESAAPLKGVECDFAVDSSGFSTCNRVRWYDEKYGRMRTGHTWLKAHVMVGVKTNVVTSVEVTGPDDHDSPYLPPLLEATAKRFQISEVSADKGYTSKKNLEAIVSAGATPYIPFKVNTTGNGPELWRKLWHFYQYNRQEFLASYHKRSNVESTFSMIKAKFGASLRSKGTTAQTNELLCKVLCHNLCCLVASIYELGVEPAFWAA